MIYDAHDYDKVRAFLQQTDYAGTTNGKKLNPDYDADNVQTWTGVTWANKPTGMQIEELYVIGKSLVGVLDLAACKSLPKWPKFPSEA